ncbi:glucose transport protein [Anopheles darlingi]|uniref:Glucose transport protein n=1 Tax=Anopheles darlingi TaxID=43151 RepID=W5JI57_ANODA|nr:glucose transport protein [Anopheles darlingi]
MGCTEWLEMNQKNKPQSNALATGILTLLTTGSYLAATLFDSGLSHQEWTFGRSQPAITFTLLVFHVTAVAGSIAAYLLLERYTKKQINYVLVACVTVGCIVGIAVPSNLIAVAFGRGLMGFAHGLAYPVVLVHGGEIIVKELRGIIMASVNFCIVSGVMLGSVFNSITEEGIPPYRLLGILGLVYMLLSVFLNYFLCYESPVFLVERKLDGQAIQSMIKLRNESNETWEIRNELTEIKTMLSEDELTTRSILQDGNLRPLVLIALGKLAAVLSFNYAINSIKYIVIDDALSQDHDTFSLATTVLMTIRLLGGMVGMFIVDLLGRRALVAVSSLSTGLLLTAIGITYLAADSLSSDVAMVILFACEVGSSLGLTFVPDVLCSEAFNTRKKVLSIVVVQLLENVLQVIIFAITFEWNFAVQDRYGGTLLVAGVPLVAIAYVLYQKLPETSKMSIRQARIEFYKRDGIVFGGSKNSVEVLYD